MPDYFELTEEEYLWDFVLSEVPEVKSYKIKARLNFTGRSKPIEVTDG